MSRAKKTGHFNLLTTAGSSGLAVSGFHQPDTQGRFDRYEILVRCWGKMSTEHTRRDFLRLSAAGLAAGAASEALPAWGSLHPGNPSGGEITVRVTDEKRRFERVPAIAW